MTIHSVPNLSVTTPNRPPQNAARIGIPTLPFAVVERERQRDVAGIGVDGPPVELERFFAAPVQEEIGNQLRCHGIASTQCGETPPPRARAYAEVCAAALGVWAPASVSRRSASGSSRSRTPATRSRSCSGEVALAIGALIPG